MLRELLIWFGLVEVAWPRPVVELCERIGLENPEAVQRRPRAEELARLEGMAVVWVLHRQGQGQGSKPLAVLLGVAGIVAVLVPGPLIRLTQRVVYENTDELELSPWVRPAARVLGLLYLIVLVLSLRGDDTTSAGRGADGSPERTAKSGAE